MQEAGLPTSLSACGVGSGILSLLAEEAAEQWTAKFNPRPVSERDLVGLFERAL
jgi:alcohol dehydrogenase